MGELANDPGRHLNRQSSGFRELLACQAVASRLAVVPRLRDEGRLAKEDS